LLRLCALIISHHSLQAHSSNLHRLRQSHLCSPFPACYLSSSSLADTPSSPDKLSLRAVTSAICLGSIAMMWGYFNWLQCHGFFAVSIGFIAMGSLPFQLASKPRVLCRFNWLHCHGFIAISIGFNATSSLPFQLASLPWVQCHFNWL
jgi:hypothetical protein